MRSFFDLFRVSRGRQTRAKTTLMPQPEALESRNLLARPALANINALFSGVFVDPVGATSPVTGVGTNTIQFGTPFAPGGQPSTLSYTGVRFPTPIRVLNHHENSGVQIGQFTFDNTLLSSPSITGIVLQLTISSNVGSRTVRVPFQIDVTPNVDGTDGPDTIRLVGRPVVRLIRGFAVQIVGFGIPNAAGGRPTLARQFTVSELQTQSFTLIGKVIRR